ncbi:hypothetical protein JCM1841_004429 [Sporobolomyces salmonicolor]
MFAQGSTSSPFRSGNPSQPFGTPQQSSSFSQQQTSSFAPSSSAYYASNSANQPTFAGPQFGGGNSQYGGGSLGGSGYGQFGAGGAAGGGAHGSPFGQSGMQGSTGAAAGGTPNFGEVKKRNYLPGYLSGGAAAQAPTPPQAMGNDNSWDSPARRTSVSGSPVARFGGGSLFGGRDNTPSKSPKYTAYTAPPRGTAYRAEMEEDAPPVASLHEFDSEPTPHADLSFSGLRHSPSVDPTASPFASTATPLHPAPNASTGYAVNVFGFPSSALELILDYFSQFGEIMSKTPSQEGGNWVTIVYAQPWAAARAVRKNGEVLGGVLMVGVKAVDEDGLRRALAGSEGSDGLSSHVPTPTAGTPRPASVAGGASGVGKPVQVLGPQAAFKAAPTPPRKGFLGLGGAAATPTTGAPAGADPHASLFAEKSRQAVMQQQGQGQKGVLGKVSDLVFGW